MKKALVIIDLQNDYFPGGKFPLWKSDVTLENTEKAIQVATAKKVPILLVQHIANSKKGLSPFFNSGTEGVGIHRQILAAAPKASVVVKEHADAFLGTTLEETLSKLGITQLLLCGMMTQNCVTHTAISKSAEKYEVTVLSDCCTTVDEMIHKIALNALSSRVSIMESENAL